VSAARLATDPDTREIADAIQASLPFATPGSEATVELLAITLHRIRRAVAAIDRADTEGEVRTPAEHGLPYARLRDELRGWIRLAAKLAGDLALTPASFARLQRDLGVGADAGARAQIALERLRDHLDEHHPSARVES
jgi:hypothetical protein